MSEDVISPRIEATFRAVNSTITAGNNVNLYNSVTINKLESSILSRLQHALNPVTSASYDSYEADQRSECFPNTRVQVLNDIEAWINSDSHKVPIYVLDGVAGIGKSTLAQTIAVRSASAGFLGASFFFSRDEDLRKAARYFFPTIAYQLACHDGQFAGCISHSLEQNPDAPTKRLHQQLSLLLLGPLQELLEQRAKPTLIVVDALDECAEENAEELLSLLGQHAHRMKSLKILITMRPESHLRGVLEQDKNHEGFRLHEIEDYIVHSDIRLYLQSRLSVEEVRKISRNRRTSWQPTAKDMQMLCGICGTLFIIAATATRFILDRKRSSPEKQLARLLDGVSPSGFTGSRYTNVLDETYIRVIFAAQPDLDEGDEDWFRELNNVLGTLVTLATPLPCDALSSLLDMEPDYIEDILSQLHSLVAPSGSEDNVTFRIHHKSFPDFITNKERICKALSNWKGRSHPDQDSLLWIDTTNQHLRLSKACFRIMNRDLRWNMADIDGKDWHKDKDEILHINPRLIPPDLAYAALHWSSHLLAGDGLSKDLELQKYLDEWSSKHMLAWMEVTIILDQFNKINVILQEAMESIKRIPGNAWTEGARVQELLSDSCRLLHQGNEIMKLSTLHVYWSCLPFVPEKTQLYRAYRKQAIFTLGLGKSYHWEPLLGTLTGHLDSVYAVAFSSNGSRLASASGSNDKTVRLWDATTGAHIFTLYGHSSGVFSVSFSNNGSLLASGSGDQSIRFWNVATGAHVATLNGHSDLVWSVAFSNDGLLLASGSGDRTVRLWTTATGAPVATLNGHSSSVKSVAFSSDDSRLASGSFDNTVRLWDPTTGVHIFTLSGHTSQVNSVAFSRYGSRLASGSSDKTVRLWDATTGAHISTLNGHSDAISSVAFSSDGLRLASGSYDKTVRIWDATTGAHISTLSSHLSVISSVAFSSDGLRLASGTYDRTVKLWDVIAGDGARPFFESSVQLRDVKKGVYVSALGPPGHLGLVKSVALSRDGSRLASGSIDNTIRLWDAETGDHTHTFTGHSGAVYSIVFSSDCSRLASGSGDRTVKIWDVKTGTCTGNFTEHSEDVKCVVFSNKGFRLASGSNDNTVRIWDTTTGARLFTLGGHWMSVCSIAFSSDDSRLASGSDDETVRLWDARTGAHISTLTAHPKPIKLFTFDSVAFLGDHSPLVFGSSDDTVSIWDVQTGSRTAAFTAASNLTIISAIPLHNDFQMGNFQVVRREATNSPSLMLLVQRDTPQTRGLIIVNLSSGQNWEVIPVCWFPLGVEVQSFSFNYAHSQIAVGCRGGQVMLLDFSPKSTQA